MENDLKQETASENEGMNMRKPKGRRPKSPYRRGVKIARANFLFLIFLIIGILFLISSIRAGEPSAGIFVLIVIIILFLLGG